MKLKTTSRIVAEALAATSSMDGVWRNAASVEASRRVILCAAIDAVIASGLLNEATTIGGSR